MCVTIVLHSKFSLTYLPFLLFFLLFAFLCLYLESFSCSLKNFIISCSGICWWSMSGSYFLFTHGTYHSTIFRLLFFVLLSQLPVLFYWFEGNISFFSGGFNLFFLFLYFNSFIMINVDLFYLYLFCLGFIVLNWISGLMLL